MRSEAKQTKQRKLTKKSNAIYTMMCIPGIICLILFTYVPCYGILMAFKDYNYRDGIWGSPWVGFENFRAFFATNDFYRVVGNTVMYNLIWTFTINIGLAAIVAILLYEVKNKYANKVYQVCLLIPGYVSFVAFSYGVFILLSHESGLVNKIIKAFGGEAIMWYREPQFWPLIITIVVAITQVGAASLYFYAALMNIDTGLFDAAKIDGAGKLRQIWTVMIPEMIPMIVLILVTRMGGIINSGLDPFYTLTFDAPELYATTDVMGTYLYRAMTSSDFGVGTAVSLFSNVVGLVLLLITNKIVKLINKEMAVY